MAGQDQASEAQRSKPPFGRACSREGTAPYSTREPPFYLLFTLVFLLILSDCLFLQRLILANMWQLIINACFMQNKKYGISCF